MSKSKEIRVGVRDLYVALITETETESGTSITYGTPEVFGGTATVGVSEQRGDNKVYESDVGIHNGSRLVGATVSYESRTVMLENELKVLHGITTEGNGGYEDGPDDEPKKVAVGWAAPMTGGKYKCQWYYYCDGHKGDETYETATENTSTPTDRFEFDCIPSPATGKLRRRKICESKAEMEAFFAAVLPTASANTGSGTGN